MFDVERATTVDAARALRDGRTTPLELLAAALERVVAWEPTINALVALDEAGARAQAITATNELAAGRDRGPLQGIPLIVKDLYDVEGFETTASSLVRRAGVATTDAECVARLRRAGMVVLAKAHTHEYAYGGITPQSKNPWDPSRITGGSSGGTAAALAAGEGLLGLGTDTAGSIRIPATLCGVVGLKPTFGRVSRRGVTSLAWSLDHAGPMARSVRDVALALQCLAGYDEGDRASAREPVSDYVTGLDRGVAGVRVGVPENYFFDHCARDVVTALERVVHDLEAAGAVLVPFVAPLVELYESVEFTIVSAEAGEYHYETLRREGERYGEHTRALLEAGQTIFATDYIRALRLRSMITDAWRDAFANVDVVLAPALPDVAALVGARDATGLDGWREDLDGSLTRLLCPSNLTGRPSLSLRVGFRGALPLGAQVIGRAFDEATVLRVGRAVERSAGEWASGPFPALGR